MARSTKKPMSSTSRRSKRWATTSTAICRSRWRRSPRWPRPPAMARCRCAGVRSGDTPASQRQKMLRHPPHILVTTPESLYLLLTSNKSRQLLGSVETVIVDEIHALVRDKRGSHLALALERLEALNETPPVRVGLSATQRPMDAIARFFVGTARRRRRRHARLPDHRRRTCPRAGSGYRSSAQRLVGRLLARAMGRNPCQAHRVDRRASQHADLREHAAAGRARGPSPARTTGRGSRGGASWQPISRDSPIGRNAAQSRSTARHRGHRFARDGHRYRLHRLGLPDRRAPLDRHVLAARGARRALAGQSAQGPTAAADARRIDRVAGAGAGGAWRKTGPRGNPRRAARHPGPADRGQRRLRGMGRGSAL